MLHRFVREAIEQRCKVESAREFTYGKVRCASRLNVQRASANAYLFLNA
jgi:hypothetical protein